MEGERKRGRGRIAKKRDGEKLPLWEKERETSPRLEICFPRQKGRG